MNSVVLPPSPNWCLDNILVCARDGTVAWGAKNFIVIAEPLPEDNTILTYRIIVNAHFEKVTSLAFSPDYGKENNRLLLSGGGDNVAKIWNLNDLSISYANSDLDAHQKIAAVDWFKSDPKAICYASENGQVVYWNISHYHNWMINLSQTITCLSCCPHDSYTVAVGLKNGLVYIIDTQRPSSVIYKLRSHDTQIVSLSWCPVPTNVITESNNKDMLLASGGKDRSIFIWRAGGDGRYEIFINLPNQVLDSSIHRSKVGCNDLHWIALNWVEPKLLLSSSSWGELISWDLSNQKNYPTCSVVHAFHGRGLYCIATVPFEHQIDESNWRKTNNITIWTVAQDRQVICYEVKPVRNMVKYRIPTQGGFVYCMAACPLETSVIAFGAGDRMLRLWGLSAPHKNLINIATFWQKIMGKVRSIAWHPKEENLLAFGTEEGRVGIFDTNNTKPPTLCRQYHRDVVYSLGWGPVPGKNNFELYTNSSGELAYYELSTPQKEPTVVIAKGCTEFSWKPDYTCMAVGFKDGSIKFYNKDHIQIYKTIQILNKSIFCLAWHPESTASDTALSLIKNYLAIANDSNTVTILEIFSIDSENPSKDEVLSKKISLFYKTVATLNGHTEKVVTLAWSPYISGQLLSGSYDGTIQVWKVENQEILKTFNGHVKPVLCCMWSPLDPDYVISGSADFTLRIWKISDQQVILPMPKPKKSKSKENKSKLKLTKTSCIKHEETSNNINKDSTLNCLEALESNGVSPESELAIAKPRSQGKMNKDEYFDLYRKSVQNKEFLFNSIRNILKGDYKNMVEEKEKVNEENEVKVSNDEIKSIFYEKEITLKIVDNEVKYLKSKNCLKHAMELDVWRNQLQQTVNEAIRENKLNDYIVSLTPSLSFKVWQETCEIYAMQLTSEKLYKKAATFMLNINKVYEAIGIYINANMYTEAYILATCRLDPSDSIFTRILKNWSSYAIRQGKFEESVQCLVKLGDYTSAAKLLSRREGCLQSLELAIELAIESKDNDLAEALAEQAIKTSLLKGNCKIALSIVEKFPQVNYRELLITVCTKLFEINKTPLTSHVVSKKILDGGEIDLMEYFQKLYDKEKLSNFYTKLSNRDFAVEITNEKSLLVAVSHQMSLAISTDSKETRMKHIVTALGMISHFELTNCQASKNKTILISMILALDKRPLLDKQSLFNDREFESSKSLRAYFCLAIFTWFARAEDASDYIESIAKIIGDYIPDVFDQKAVNYWTMNMNIDKIESQLSKTMGKTKSMESESNGEDQVQDLVEKLNKMKMEKKDFTDSRVCVPSPVVAYCVALEFGSKIVDEELALQFSGPINKLWSNLQI